MLGKTCRLPIIVVLAVALGLLLLGEARAAAQAEKTLPKFSEIKQTVLNYFMQQSAGGSSAVTSRQPKFDSSEIISRNQVKAVFDLLRRQGWNVQDQKAILEATLPDNDFLVRQLRTPAGKKFARQIARLPLGYDRTDRLCRIPRGEQTVKDLIRGPGGYKMIQYMTTSEYGKNLGDMISKDPGGKDFNKPTGRIYTVDMLLKRLEQEYAKATGKKSVSQ